MRPRGFQRHVVARWLGGRPPVAAPLEAGVPEIASSRVESSTGPWTPLPGSVMRERTLSSLLFSAPFRAMMSTTSHSSTSKQMS